MAQMPTLGQPMPAGGGIDPAVVHAQLQQAERRQKLADALRSMGYVPNSGALGAVAQIASALKGRKVDRQANETIAEALKRKFAYENQELEKQRAEAQAKYERDRADKRDDTVFAHQLEESSTPAELKTLRALLKDPTLMQADLQRRAAMAAAVRAPPQPSALREKIDILGQLGADPTQIRDSVLDLPAPKPPRALPGPALEKLSRQADIGTNLADMAGSFSDKYAGNTITGGLETLAGRIGGERIGVADEGQADWWQAYDRQKNEVRNALFGSALTPSEQQAFEKADINPRMDPKRIRANLATQDKIVRAGLARRAAAWKAQGFDPGAIEAATSMPGFPGGVQPPGAPPAAAAPAGAPPLVSTPEQFAALPSGATYRQADGEIYRKP